MDDKLIQQLQRLTQISVDLEADLGKVIKMRNLAKGEELSVQGLRGGVILIDKGILREQVSIHGEWVCNFIFPEKDGFRYLYARIDAGFIFPRLMALEDTSLFFIDPVDIPPLKAKHPYFFNRLLKIRDLTGPDSLTGYMEGKEPAEKLKALRDRIPKLASRVEKKDLAECLRINEQKLEELLGTK